MNIAIVVVGYKRNLSLKRLLDSIKNAIIDSKTDLIISLDGKFSDKVLKVAENFSSAKFNKILIKNKEKLGLRNHIISCGDIVNDYDGIIVLEDDLVVDKYFFIYSKTALKFYALKESVAGVGLYSYEYNEFANLPFNPINNGYDSYLMQVPCSWGQCWTKSQWQKFKDWYHSKNRKYLNQVEGIPEQVKEWPESSWKKYFHAYLIENDLYFVYPYVSLSTNCADAGTHIKTKSSRFQVCLPLQERQVNNFNFCPHDFIEVRYDAFFEPNGDFIYRSLNINSDLVSIDLYGIKPDNIILKKEFCLTIRKVDKYETSYPLIFKPIEFNLNFPSKEKLELNLCKSVDIKLPSKRKHFFYEYYIVQKIFNKSFLKYYLIAAMKKMVNKISRKL